MTAHAGRWLRRVPTVVGVVLVLGSVPSATSAQTAVDSFVGYQAAASGTAFTAFPTVPALLPVEVPFEATIALATATLSSGGQGFGRASTFYPGTLTAGLRPLLETGAGVRLPIPDYPIVVEAREFEEAKHSEVPGITMAADVDPERAVAVADAGTMAIPAVVGVRSLHTESRVLLETGKITSISTTTLNGIDVLGAVTIGTLVSTAKVTSDGTTATCEGGVTVSGVTVAGTPATLDESGLHVGALVDQVLAGTGINARVLGGDDGCTSATGSRTTAGVLISFPLPELGSVPPGGGFSVVLGSTSANAGASVVPSEDTSGGGDLPPVFGDVVTRLPGPFSGGGVLPPAGGGTDGGEQLPAEQAASYDFDGVPLSLLVGLVLLAVVASARVRRYMDQIIGLVGPP